MACDGALSCIQMAFFFNGLDFIFHRGKRISSRKGGGIMIRAGIMKNEIKGTFRVNDGVKMNSEGYCCFLGENI